MKRILASAACAVLAACGGGHGGGNGSNAALGTTFTYGAPQSASAAQTAAVQDQVSTILGVQASPSTSDPFTMADFGSVSGTLLGGQAASFPIVVGAPESLARAAVAQGGPRFAALAHDATFQNPSCAVATSTSVTLTGCVLSESGLSATVSGQLRSTPPPTPPTGASRPP